LCVLLNSYAKLQIILQSFSQKTIAFITKNAIN
jgi:hypothetical protein